MADDPRFETLRMRLPARPRPGAWPGLVIRARHTDREDGYERMRATLLGGAGGD